MAWGWTLFAVEAGALAAIIGFAVAWHYGLVALWPPLFNAMRGLGHAGQYVQWFLAAAAGTLVYLLRNLAYWSRHAHHFRRHVQWNLSTLMTGPIVALMVMWLLTNLTVVITPADTPDGPRLESVKERTFTVPDGPSVSTTETTQVVSADIAPASSAASNQTEAPASAGGVVLDINKLALEAQLALAFVLGFFGRTTTRQLELITRKLLPEAWNLAEASNMEITPAYKRIVAGASAQFSTTRPVDVLWSAKGGDIGQETGLFVAPKLSKTEFDAQEGTSFAAVSLQAKNAAGIVRSATVEIVPFLINGPDYVEPGEHALYTTTPAIDGVVWKASGSVPIDEATGVLSPSEDDGGETITVRAVSDEWHHIETKLVTIPKPPKSHPSGF